MYNLHSATETQVSFKGKLSFSKPSILFSDEFLFPHTNQHKQFIWQQPGPNNSTFLQRQSHWISSLLPLLLPFRTMLTLSRTNLDFKSRLQHFRISASEWRTKCYPAPSLIFLSPCSSFFRCFTACRISLRWGSSSAFWAYRRKCFTVSESNTSGSTSTRWRRNILSQAMA